jgi:hypothetical protein
LVIPQLCLQGARDIADANSSLYCLTAGTTATSSVSTVTLALSTTDAGSIKNNPALGFDVNSTYLSFEYFTGQDYAGNQLLAISRSAAKRFSSIVADTLAPTLDAFIFDASASDRTLMTLIFSEPVDTAALDLLKLTIQSRFASRDGAQYRLTGGTVVEVNLNEVTIQLLASDVTNMKLIPDLIRDKQSTYLVVDALTTTDLAGNALIPYLDGAALASRSFLQDASAARIVTSTFDVNGGKISFLFNEPILLKAVDVTALTVQVYPTTQNLASLLSTGYSPYKYTLTSLSTVSNADSLSETVEIELSLMDQNEIKNRFPLASSLATTWFSYTPLFAQDVSKNKVSQVFLAAPLQATVYGVDSTRPVIGTYALDMNARAITLTFSEAVRASTVDLSQLVMQNLETRRWGQYVYLNESTFSIGDGAASNILTVSIGPNTYAYMMLHGIGSEKFKSFLSWTDSFVADNALNYLLPQWDASVLGNFAF